MGRFFDVLTALGASSARLGAGIFASRRPARQPPQLLELYEFEACPYCRKVRDALTVLDLDALILPCPKGGTRFRPKVVAEGGKAQFPYLIDPNTGRRMYESDDIVAYLFGEYADRRPTALVSGPLATASSMAASACRPRGGARARPSRKPAEPLELYSFSASPYAILVRETLCELELPYHLHSVGKGARVDWLPPAIRPKLAPNAPPTTANRQAFVARAGRVQVPYLVDPNEGVSLFESAEICRHLNETYAV
ncbi:MAG: glutathione S-transferase N-terminal domain-containing protein [Deltaproteobacteria bacterium]|jgi:glutathione S-transferase|nr:glutathione S-transferase N-terminal domain-containing protein [Deltaproteobacteria bacterium]MBW2535668.1 glutathione S-transferase N-terminal domain-containing protein [Deltaproteobacteria bacterium]